MERNRMFPMCILVVFFVSFGLPGAQAQKWEELNMQGMKAYNAGDFKGASEYWEKALKQTEKEFGKKHRNYTTACNNLALLYQDLGLYNEAEKLYIEARNIEAKTRGKRRLDYADICSNLGSLYEKLGRYDEAESLYKESFYITGDLLGKNSVSFAVSCNNLAGLYHKLNQFYESEVLFKKAKKIFGSDLEKNHDDYATVCDNLASLYIDLGRYSEAEALYIEAKTIRATILGVEHPDYALACNNLGHFYHTQGQYTKAESLYDTARNIKALVYGKEHPSYAITCSNLAGLYSDMGRFKEAESLYLEVRSIRSNIVGKEHPDYALACNNLANLYHDLGRYSEAEPLYMEAKNIYASALGKKHSLYANSSNDLATLYRDQGRFKEAEVLYQEAKDIYAAVFGEDHPDYALTCNNLGSLYEYQNRYSEAESLYIEAKNIFAKTLGKEHPYYATSCNNLAGLYMIQRRYNEAEQLYIEAKNINSNIQGKEHPFYATSCNNLAELYRIQGRYSTAEALYVEAKIIRENVLGKEHPEYAEVCNNLALLYESQGRYSDAEKLYIEAFTIKQKEIERNFKNLSETEKEQYLKANIDLFENNFLRFIWQSSTQNPAIASYGYQLAISTKGLILNSTEKIKQRILNSNNPELKKLFLEWKAVRDTYNKAHNLTIEQRKEKKLSLDSLEKHANELEKQLALKSEDFANTFTPKPVRWQDIQQKLAPDEAAIEIVRLEWSKDSIGYMAFVLTRDVPYPRIVTFTNGKAMETRNFTYYRNALLHQLKDTLSYSIYWKPLAKALNNIRKAYIAPDGIYHKISISTLFNPRQGKYLSDEIMLVQLTNTRDLLKPKKPFGKGEYLIGNPKFDLNLDLRDNTRPREYRNFSSISPLPGAEQEVMEIASLLKTPNVVTGEQATEEYVKQLRSPLLLHIATHGYFEGSEYESTTQAMRNAGLLLAGAVDYDRMYLRPYDKDDGKLTAFEVMNMELEGTELVVLSACETGLGEVRKEGVYGLQRAFREAGAEMIMMSLWKVSDEATRRLMTEFYQNWRTKGMDKRQAFETAQATLRKHYPAPFYWGAFVLIE